MTIELKSRLTEFASAPSQSAAARLRARLPATHMLALLDQALVSGASFLTTVMIGHWADARQLGHYALGLSALVSAFAVQEALISLPYAINRRQPLGVDAPEAGHSLAQNAMLSLLGVALFVAAAIGFSFDPAKADLAAICWMLAAVAPFALTREFVRRFAFAHFQMRRVLALDASVSTLQILLLGWFAWRGQMSALTGIAALGAASAAPTIIWLLRARRSFAFSPAATRAAVKTNWGLGKWLLVGQLSVQVQTYVTVWLTAGLIGASGAGVFAACVSIVATFNPLVAAFTNIMTPKSVEAFAQGGDRLRRQCARDALLLGATMAPLCLVLAVWGGALIERLYPHPEYVGQGHLVTVLALGALAAALGLPASNALAAMKRPRAIVWVRSIVAVFTVLLVWRMLLAWGLLGAAYGILIGQLAASAGRWIAFLKIAPNSLDVSAAAYELTTQMVGGRDRGALTIAPLGEGAHANVVDVTLDAAWGLPNERNHFVAKIFKSGAGLDFDEAEAQFAALQRLGGGVAGQNALGWEICIPTALHFSAAPLALAMSAVPGRDVNLWLASADRPDDALIDEIAEVSIAALRPYWASGRVHGDFALQNMLCAATSRQLAFIDPGTPEICRACNAAERRWTPAARDIAHLICDVATDVKQSIGDADARRRRQRFAQSALGYAVRNLPSASAQGEFLAQIRDCLDAHLEEILALNVSPRGLWRLIVKRIALRRIEHILGRQAQIIDAARAATPPPIVERPKQAIGERR